MTNNGDNTMTNALDMAGTAAGILGILVCLASGVSRLVGVFYVAGVPIVTVFLAGAGVMLAGCYLKLEASAQRARAIAR